MCYCELRPSTLMASSQDTMSLNPHMYRQLAMWLHPRPLRAMCWVVATQWHVHVYTSVVFYSTYCSCLSSYLALVCGITSLLVSVCMIILSDCTSWTCRTCRKLSARCSNHTISDRDTMENGNARSSQTIWSSVLQYDNHTYSIPDYMWHLQVCVVTMYA